MYGAGSLALCRRARAGRAGRTTAITRRQGGRFHGVRRGAGQQGREGDAGPGARGGLTGLTGPGAKSIRSTRTSAIECFCCRVHSPNCQAPGGGSCYGPFGWEVPSVRRTDDRDRDRALAAWRVWMTTADSAFWLTATQPRAPTRRTGPTLTPSMARCVTAQAVSAASGSGIFLLLSRRSHTKGRSSVSLSSGDTPPAPEPRYRTPLL